MLTKIKKALKIFLLTLAGTCTILLVAFRGDYRVLAGFEEVYKAREGKEAFHGGYDPALDEENLISRVFSSHMSTIRISGANPHITDSKDWETTRSGPTLIVFKSGRRIISAGVVIAYDSVEDTLEITPL